MFTPYWTKQIPNLDFSYVPLIFCEIIQKVAKACGLPPNTKILLKALKKRVPTENPGTSRKMRIWGLGSLEGVQ